MNAKQDGLNSVQQLTISNKNLSENSNVLTICLLVKDELLQAVLPSDDESASAVAMKEFIDELSVRFFDEAVAAIVELIGAGFSFLHTATGGLAPDTNMSLIYKRGDD